MATETEFLIETVVNLNSQYADFSGDDEESPFTYQTDGFSELVKFGNHIVFNSENEDCCPMDDVCAGLCPTTLEKCEVRQKNITALITRNYRTVLDNLNKWQTLTK